MGYNLSQMSLFAAGYCKINDNHNSGKILFSITLIYLHVSEY